MRRLMFSLLAAALLAPTGAHAGAFTDDLEMPGDGILSR